ncbi:MAG: CapA family protein [Patescibacteria group bacterium]|nr:CapA family protein [Patescibacteria group bacterium]
MKRSRRRLLRNNKTALIFCAVLLIIGAILSVVFIQPWPKAGKASKNNKTEVYEYEQYYVPINHFSDKIDTISFAELKNKLANESNEDVYVSADERENVRKLFNLDNFQPKVQFLGDQEIVNLVGEKSNRLAIVPFQTADSRVKTLKVDNKLLWDKTATDYTLKLKLKTSDKSKASNAFIQNKITLLTNVGDVILGRHVAYKMRTYNDYTHPWLKMADLLKKGDITFADLETPLSDRVSPPDEGMSFIAPQKSIAGLKMAGVDIVALANNHSTNYGVNVFNDTLELLKKEGISYVGGGINSEEAYRSLFIERNGLKWGFVDFNSIIGAINATDDSAGVAKFAIKPWAEIDDQTDIARIKTMIKETKKQADIVVAEFHWGVEYQADPIQSQVNVAHAAMESGADLIVGTHPHVVQGAESYQGKPILYSLGNFIFDQEWSMETKQGVVAEAYFYSKKLVDIRLIPYQIEDYNQPGLTTEDQSNQILNRIFTASISKEFQN